MHKHYGETNWIQETQFLLYKFNHEGGLDGLQWLDFSMNLAVYFWNNFKLIVGALLMKFYRNGHNYVEKKLRNFQHYFFQGSCYFLSHLSIREEPISSFDFWQPKYRLSKVETSIKFVSYFYMRSESFHIKWHFIEFVKQKLSLLIFRWWCTLIHPSTGEKYSV